MCETRTQRSSPIQMNGMSCIRDIGDFRKKSEQYFIDKTLKNRGWKRPDIEKYLGEPDYQRADGNNPNRIRSFYDVERVLEAEILRDNSNVPQEEPREDDVIHPSDEKILTPNDTRWDNFIDSLTIHLRVKGNPMDENSFFSDCDGSFRLSQNIIENRFPDIDLKATLDYFRKNGWFCDCSIFFRSGRDRRIIS